MSASKSSDSGSGDQIRDFDQITIEPDAKALKAVGLHGGASIYDVADQADVSIVTVSRVFNDYPHVSQKMRERVFAAARRVGYTPRLVSKRNVIGAIIGHLDYINAGDYKCRLLLHMVRMAAKVGYLVEYIPFASVDLATKHLVNGMIAVGLTTEEVGALSNLPNVPRFLVNMDPDKTGWSTVCCDHYDEALQAIRYLAGLRHRRVALVLDDDRNWGALERRRGFEQGLKDAGIDNTDPLILCASRKGAEEMARELLAAKCTAVINLSDNMGFALLDVLTNVMKVKIPEDISVIGLENEAVSRYFHPRLTTIEQPLETLAENAVTGVLQQLPNRKRRISMLVRSKLVIRDSVRALS